MVGPITFVGERISEPLSHPRKAETVGKRPRKLPYTVVVIHCGRLDPYVAICRATYVRRTKPIRVRVIQPFLYRVLTDLDVGCSLSACMSRDDQDLHWLPGDRLAFSRRSLLRTKGPERSLKVHPSRYYSEYIHFHSATTSASWRKAGASTWCC